jgi:hypothetical protein
MSSLPAHVNVFAQSRIADDLHAIFLWLWRLFLFALAG